jgi:hypothetical protein
VQTPRLALALTIAVIVICARIVVGGQTWDDVAYHTEVAPPRLAAAAQLVHGTLPGWWDGAGLGVPLLAEPSHGAAYPLVWLARSPRALDWLIVLHLAWAALGIAIWARRRGAGELTALAAGLFVVTSGAVIGAGLRGALFGIAHLPWIAWSAEAVRERRASVVLGASLGLVALSGQLAILVDAVVLALVLARPSWRLAAALGAGLLVGALQWVPVLATLGTTAGSHYRSLAVHALAGVVAPSSLYIGASVLVLAVLAVLGGSWRLGVVTAVALALAAMHVGAPELQLAVIAVIAAGASAPVLDQLTEGQRRPRLALLAGAVLTIVALGFSDDRARVHGGIGVACTLAAVAVAWRVRAAWRTPVILVLVIAPGVGGLGLAAPTDARSIVEDKPVWVQAIGERPPPLRMYWPAAMTDVAPGAVAGVERTSDFRRTVNTGAVMDLADAIATLAGSSAAHWGIDAARTDDPGRPRDTDRTWAASAHDGGLLLARYGITLAVLPAQKLAGVKPLGMHGAYGLVELNGGPLPASPPAEVALDWTYTEDSATALAQLFSDAHPAPKTLVVLSGRGSTSQESGGHMGPCTIGAWTDGVIDLTCTSPTDAFAVVSSSALPGWSATVDDRAAPWITADVIRRAVAFPAGTHHVHWGYKTPGRGLGLLVTALGIAVLFALSLIPPSPPSTPDRAPRASS